MTFRKASIRKSIPYRTSLTVLRERQRLEKSVPRLRRAAEAPPQADQEFGRTYRKPTAPAQPVEIVIPPRSTQSPHYHVTETIDRYSVRVDFPLPIAPDDVRWQVEGDILEIDYVGRDYHYYRNFVVPVGWPYSVSYPSHSFQIEFEPEDQSQ